MISLCHLSFVIWRVLDSVLICETSGRFRDRREVISCNDDRYFQRAMVAANPRRPRRRRRRGSSSSLFPQTTTNN